MRCKVEYDEQDDAAEKDAVSCVTKATETTGLDHSVQVGWERGRQMGAAWRRMVLINTGRFLTSTTTSWPSSTVQCSPIGGS